MDEYLRTLANTMGLTDWSFTLKDMEHEDALATITVSFGRQEACIELSPAFYAADPEEQRTTLIHELLHAHHAPVDELMENALPEALGKEALAVFAEAYRIMVERMIDPVSVAIANMGVIPLPPRDE